MEFVLLLKLKIADRCRIWRIHHFVIGEVQSQNHSCGLMKFLFCSRVLARFLRVWICFGWISGCVVQFYPAIFEMCGPRTGSHTGTRFDIRPCFGRWRQRRSSRPPKPPIGGGPGQLWGPKLV